MSIKNKSFTLNEITPIVHNFRGDIIRLNVNINSDDIIIVGSIRRKCNLINDVDIIIISSSPIVLPSNFTLTSGGNKQIFGFYNINELTIPFNIWLCSDHGYIGAMTFSLTGPKGYVIGYRRKATTLGCKMNQYGIFRGKDCLSYNFSELDIYNFFNKKWKDAELRGL